MNSSSNQGGVVLSIAVSDFRIFRYWANAAYRSLGFGSLADRMDDIRTVMDAAGIERAALFGVSEGGPLRSFLRRRIPTA